MPAFLADQIHPASQQQPALIVLLGCVFECGQNYKRPIVLNEIAKCADGLRSCLAVVDRPYALPRKAHVVDNIATNEIQPFTNILTLAPPKLVEREGPAHSKSSIGHCMG